MKKELTVLSLFDGIACGMQALKEENINVKKYYASEIDPYAIKVAMHNHTEIIQLGDITKWREWDIDWSSIDMIIGGSPCQGFSTAGKKLNFEDPRSKLFFIFIDILNYVKTINPKVFFLLENVNMKPSFRKIIDTFIGITSIQINSNLVSGQNRPRAYWCNLDIKMPTDLHISLSNVLNIRNCKIGQPQPYPINYKKLGLPRAERIEYRSDNKSNAIITNTSKNQILLDNGKHRTLTPNECEKLQTLPENYTNIGISNTQRYKCIGNGWTIAVIRHIFSFLPDEFKETQ